MPLNTFCAIRPKTGIGFSLPLLAPINPVIQSAKNATFVKITRLLNDSMPLSKPALPKIVSKPKRAAT